MQAFASTSQSVASARYSRAMLPARGSLRVRAQQAGPGPETTPRPVAPRAPPSRPTPQRPAGPLLGPDGKPLEVVSVEKAGPEAWAGVAHLDSGKDDVEYNWGKTALMLGGDALALLLFAAVGRMNHGEPVNADTLNTAMPFLIGWFSAAPFMGAFSKDAQGANVGKAAMAAAKGWAVATPLALIIRGVTKGYIPPLPFMIVSTVATAVLLIGWRAALAATTKEEPQLTPAQRAAARKNKRGNPLEFLELIKSLTTRW